MDYLALAKEFLQSSYKLRRLGHGEKINTTLKGEIFALIYIQRYSEGVLPGHISDEMNISSARVAAILNSLDKKELITRTIAPDDRRKILVKLTDKGQALALAHNQKAMNCVAKALEFLGEKDAKELIRIMDKLGGYLP